MGQAQHFNQGDWDASVRSRRWRWVGVGVAIAVILVLALLYAGRVFWLNVMATEGDVPPASVLPLPTGAQIIDENTGCGSGGCATTFTVLPPEGQSPAALAEAMNAATQLEIPGTFFDPRTVTVSVRPDGNVLQVVADYWSNAN
jgi:hypothetical protein